MNEAAEIYSTGIKTRIESSKRPFGYSVEWMEWDSDFRNRGLQYGDIIIGVNEKMYTEENKNAENTKAIGGYLEATFFEESGWNLQQPVVLRIVRDEVTIEISGLLRKQRTYFDKDNRPLLGAKGPVRMSNDGFSSAWASWYERLTHHLTLFLDDKRWERSAIDNRRILAEHKEWKTRIDFLCAKYPGGFADTVLADWKLVEQILEGCHYNDITAETLEYRAIGAKRVAAVQELSKTAKEAFIRNISAESIVAFPAVNPVKDDIEKVAGKKIVLPVITFENFINDLGKTYAVIGNANDGYYFIHLNSPEMDVFFRTLFYYKAQVTPDVEERYGFIGEVLNEPVILMYHAKPVAGVMVKVIAGMAGNDNVFIDLTLPVTDKKVIFSGQEELVLFAAPPLNESASAEEVVKAMIYYIKVGDMDAWRKLFANWQIYTDWDGPPYIDMTYWMPEENYQNTWEKSRHLILNSVYDARIVYKTNMQTVVKENPAAGVPRVEQIKVLIDHIGFFDGQYRSFSSLVVHRKWVLQRLNDGPWKIRELQGL